MFELINNKKSKTALILCIYRRIGNMSGMVRCLENQTNKDFDLYISNNAPSGSPKLESFFIRKVKSFNVFMEDYHNEYKQFSRFIIAKELAESGYEKIIFIDDDEIIPNTFIQDCYDQYEEKSFKSFYAHLVEGNYWKKTKLAPGQLGNYAGTGGLVCSAKFFLDEDFFACPEEFYIIDDLWLSYYLLKNTDYKIKLLETNIEFIKDGKATAIGLKEVKQNFFDNYLSQIEVV